jgi:hypothetical protein
MKFFYCLVLVILWSGFSYAQDFSSSTGISGIVAVNQQLQSQMTPEFTVARDWIFGGLDAGFAGRTVSTRLLVWSLPWMGASILGLTLTTDQKARGFWVMNGTWGFINSAIAMIGLLTPEPSLESMRNLLLINAGVDVLYIAAGAYMLTRAEAFWQGAGWGVMLQGAFLLVFDLWQGLAIKF